MTEYCVNCGAPLKKGAIFCTKCGHKKNQDVEEKEHAPYYNESKGDYNKENIEEKTTEIEEEINDKKPVEMKKRKPRISVMENPPKFFTASLTKRIIAYIIDITLVVFLPLFQKAKETGGYLFLSTTPFLQNSIFLLYVYFVLFEWLWRGKTIGKAIVSIATTSTDNFEQPSFLQSLINPLFKATIILLPLEFIIPLFINDETEIGKNQIRLLQRLMKLVVLDMNLSLPLNRCGNCGTLQPDNVKVGDICRKCGKEFTDRATIFVTNKSK